jgi:lambda family phage portal protein
VNGIEFDPIGRRVAYWLFREHPGSSQVGFGGLQSARVPADSVLHIYRHDRPGQVRGASWFAPVLLKFKDFDEYDDAQLVKQKIAACLAVITTDPSGAGAGLGTTSSDNPTLDSLEPGMILNMEPGRTVSVVEPPRVAEFSDYAEVTLRAIATGIGVTYEDLTGDYSGMPFSAARMSRIRHWDRVNGWRWHMLIPQLCDPVWGWVMESAEVEGVGGDVDLAAEWTAPPPPMVDPANEGLAYMRNIRTGIMSLSEALRERGYDPRAVMAEIAADNTLLDKLGIILDSDPRMTTQAGNPRDLGQKEQPAEPDPPDETGKPKPPKPPTDDEEEEEE